MQLQRTHFTPAFYLSKPHLCPRRVSVNCICRLSNISLCYPHYGKWATKRFVIFFFLCTSATRSPVDEKVTASRLIVESKPNAYRFTRSQSVSERPVSVTKKKKRNKNVQINRPRDRAVGFSLHGEKKKRQESASWRRARYRLLIIIYVQLCAVLRKQRPITPY